VLAAGALPRHHKAKRLLDLRGSEGTSSREKHLSSHASTSQRVGRFSESVIRHMTRLANATEPSICRGISGLRSAEELKRAAEQAGGTGPHQYAVTGVPISRGLGA